MIKQAKSRRASQAQAAYDARLLEAYVILSLEKKSPDVPIAELYARVGGSFPKFAKTLEACCRGHHAVPTLGEPAFASETARKHVLVIEGERYLRIKFL